MIKLDVLTQTSDIFWQPFDSSCSNVTLYGHSVLQSQMWLHVESCKIAQDFVTTVGNNVFSVLFYKQYVGQKRLRA